MKTISKLTLTALAVLALTISACKKETVEPQGDVKIQFEYVFGSQALPWELGKTMVHPKTKDTLTFTEFNFYVSNIRFQRNDGSWWEEPESYHLVCERCQEASSFIIKDVPSGDYIAMEYTLGVDSARNVSGAQTGDLSPTKGMFWSWNTGYIMVKAEGESPQSPDGNFAFHLGGFSGTDNIVTPKAVDFGGNKLVVPGDQVPELKFLANPARLWHSSPSVSVRHIIHAPGDTATVMGIDFYSNVSFMGMN